MIKDAIIENDTVTISDNLGYLDERENEPLIEDIIKCENEIETIENLIKDNDICTYIIDDNIKGFKKLAKFIFGGYASIFLLALLGHKTGFFPNVFEPICYLSLVVGPVGLLPILGLKDSKKYHKSFNFTHNKLEEKLNKK